MAVLAHTWLRCVAWLQMCPHLTLARYLRLGNGLREEVLPLRFPEGRAPLS